MDDDTVTKMNSKLYKHLSNQQWIDKSVHLHWYNVIYKQLPKINKIKLQFKKSILIDIQWSNMVARKILFFSRRLFYSTFFSGCGRCLAFGINTTFYARCNKNRAI